jgi:predicted amidohydrolase/acetyl esterase/lipase
MSVSGAGIVEAAAMKRGLILACVVLGLYPGGAARAADEPLVLDVWPGKAVGDHGQIGPERVRAAADAPTKDAKWITNVTRPTISVFRPDAGNNSRVAIVICPGGGYWNLAWDKEGEEVAARLNALGITGVVLKYRVPRRPGEPHPLPAPGPLLDAQRAIRLVRSRAGGWGIDPQRIGIMGFSAGGHLAVMTAISFEKPAYEPIDKVDQASCRPDFAVAGYPGYILTRPGSDTLADYIHVPKGTGPMFLVHASDDNERGAQPEQSLALYRALRGAGVPVELHIYDEGGHGFGVRRSPRPVANWSERCAEWLKHRGILPAGVHGKELGRHDRPPRKVIVGTTMTHWYSDYPGLSGRLEQMRRLIDLMAAEARSKYGRSIDLALFTEFAVTAGKPGPSAEAAVPLDETIIEALGSKAREHKTHIVFGGVFRDIPVTGACSNAAVVIDRQGRPVGRYVKVHPVLDRDGSDGKIVLEGGVRPGAEYNVFDLDFGRVGVQICYDVEYPEGWRRLAEKGAELVLFPTASPQFTRPGMYAATHEFWVVSSTFRNNASFFEPGTGLVAAQITEPKQTLVHEIDLSYLILPWSSRLRNGAAFREAFGDRVEYRYSESEDRGVFWSNDPNRSIGEMARSLGLLETPTEQQARARDAQDRLRGGPAR